ncbi:acyl-protein thioesterase [Hypoxylon fuscum]|nr:acyl-protein thioesterase [Hypoxylon fuscum]
MANATQGGSSSAFVVEPTSHHTHTFILLHGLGSNGHKFGEELLETGVCSNGKKLPELFPGARLIFPTAKRRRSSAFKRSMLTQWFDIASLETPYHRQEKQLAGLAESAQEILSLVQKESEKVPRSNIILGGLSQGCAMSLSCLLSLEFPIGGFIGMSGWLPFQPDVEELLRSEEDDDAEDSSNSNDDNPFASADGQGQGERDPIVTANHYYRDLLGLDDLEYPSKNNSSLSTPIFLGHGEVDEKVRVTLGEAAHRTLDLVGYNVSWKAYQGQGHWYKIPDEIDDIVKFVENQVGWKKTEV